MSQLTAGVDLGGTKIQTVVLCEREIVGSSRVPTPAAGADAVIAAITDTIKMAISDGGVSATDLAGVGIGSPGTIDSRTGTVTNSPNVHGFETAHVPLAAEVSRALGGVDVKLDNDVRVATRGEWKCGAGRPYRDMLGVFVGTGVGGGLVLNGELREGRGAAGEIGHTTVKDGGRLCGCGRQGCLEAYAGRARMEWRARRWQREGRHTRLFDIMREKGRERVTSGVIAAALEKRDAVAVELIGKAVWALGIALANAQNLLDMEAIIVGGGLGDRLGRPFVERIEKAAMPRLLLRDRPPVFLTTELGDLSGAVGAAVLAGG